MKKSLVLISFAFIFLLSVSFVSANFWGWITGDIQLQPVQEKLKEGDSVAFEDGEVTIDSIDEDTGIVEGTLTNSDGSIQSFSLEEGEGTLSLEGTQFSIEDIGGTGLFGLGGLGVTISLLPPPDGTEDGDDSIIDGDNGDFGGSSCEFIEEEEAFIGLGEGTFLNGHTIDLDEDGYLIIDETYAYPLDEGGSYFVPIPNPECYWEASFDDGELYMMTVCPVEEEFIE